MPDQIYFIISLLCAVQGVLLSLIFLLKRGNHLASKVLGAYILIFSLGMLENFLKLNVPGLPGKLIFSFLGFSNFLYGPLLYFFVLLLTIGKPEIKSRQLLHFALFTFLYFSDTVLILATGNSIRQDLLEIFIFELLIIQILSYNIGAIFKLRKHGREILQIHSNLEMTDLKWLKFLLVFLTAIYVFSFAITHAVAFGIAQASQYYVLVQLLITVVIYLMSYRLLFQPQLFMLHKFEATPEPKLSISTEPVFTPEKYQRSGLKDDQAEHYLKDLLSCMETEKPYRNPDLTIHHLSEKMDISRNHLTEIINEKLGKNFFEFVNTYRVEEVKKLLTDPAFSHYNLYALGLEAGFKSKTAFNTNFKKLTGLTPSAWKNQDIPDTADGEMVLKEVLT